MNRRFELFSGNKTGLAKLLVAGMLLCVYCGFFAVNFFCNLELGFSLVSLDTGELGHGHNNDHHHTVTHSHQKHSHSQTNSNDDASEEDDRCCSDFAPVYLAALSKTTIPAIGIKINLPSTTLFTQATENPVYANPALQETDYLNKAPPLLIPDVRILFDSFII